MQKIKPEIERHEIMEQVGLHTENEETVITGKQPWLGVFLTIILPGLGHIYAKKYLWALFAFLGYTVLSAFFLHSLFLHNMSFNTLMYSFLIFAYCWVILFAYHSYKIISRSNSLEFELKRKKLKDPWKAVLLSYFIPGIGHAYLKKGGYFLLFALSYQLIDKFSAYYIHPLISFWSSLVFSGLIMLHVYHISQPIKFMYSLKKMIGIWGLMFLTNFFALCLALFIVFNVGQLYRITGDSMAPTITAGAQVLVNKRATSDPKPGDIIVFQNEKTVTPFIERIVATGGQTIEINDDGILMVDGTAFSADKITYQVDSLYRAHHRNRLFWKKPYTVPEGAYFVAGDNWNNSMDSRDFGMIKKEEIIGIAVTIIPKEDYERIMKFIF